MNHFTPPRRPKASSLIERASAAYDLNSYFAGPKTAEPKPPFVEPAPAEREVATEWAPAPAPASAPVASPLAPVAAPVAKPVPMSPPVSRPAQAIVDRAKLEEAGMLIPGKPVSILAEEFRLVKRQLLLTARSIKDDAVKARTILVCSAKPDEGKTYCAINLAISMAAERETEVLLIDGDLAKPDILARLGIPAGPGLLDALIGPDVDVESLVVRTDVPQLSVLSAGTASNDDTELLASHRTSAVIARLLAADPNRVIIFDSPPALAASPAAVLASLAGQVMMVVRADRTSEGDLREAVALLDGCEHIQLVLNQVAFTPGGSRFGSYYGTEYAK